MQIWKWITILLVVAVLGACSNPEPRQILEPEANYWQQVGSSAATGTEASLAQTATGVPVMAYHAYDGTSDNIYVKFWNGFNWVQLGTILDVNTNQDAYNPSLALDSSGNPVVSWYESDGTSNNYNIYVKRWNGSSWVQLGTVLDVNTNQAARNPSLALDSSGNPVVSWWEYDGFSLNIHVKFWNGFNWVQLGTILDANTNQG